jgi:uncharacterized protein (DUF1330 family)
MVKNGGKTYQVKKEPELKTEEFEVDVKLNAYAIKIEEIIATEHPLRSEYDAKAARVSSYTDKAHRDYLERNQGLGMKATNFIFGANRAPQYSLEEYLTEIEENQGYSPKYEEYVQKTGQLISEVEEARLLAETRFEAQEAVRKQENIRIALEQLVEEEQVKGDKLERIVAEEHLNRSVYEERRETGKAYVEEALAYHQTYVLPKIELNRKREGKRFRRKEQVLTPPNYALSEYLREVKTNQGYSEKYVEHIKATGQQIEKVEIAIENEIKRAKLTELKRRQEYLEQSAAALEKYSEQDFIRAEKLESIIGAECHSRNIYEQQLEHSATYVQNALQAYVQDPSKEQTLAEHEHVLRYTLQEYQEEISVNQGYSPKYEEYVKTTGQRNQEIEAAINEEVQKLKEHDQARKTEVLKEILAEIKEKDPRKAIVLNSLLEKERAARNNYETERQKLSAYVTALENVTASRESYVPQYTRNEYLAEIQANHGYSPKYLEDLRRTGNEQRDKEIEAEIEHAMKRYDEQELYRRSNFIDNFETEVEKLNAYAIKIEEIIATEHPLRSEYDAKAARVSSYTDKAHRDYLERNQGLGMKATNFIFGANRAPQYSLEEYLTEIEENQGYSPKYEEYVQKTGQLISEVEEARLLAETRFEAQEAVRKQENIRIALEQLVEEEQVKGDKLERIVAEEHLNRSVYEERRETGKAYVEEALAYHQTYVLPKIELNRKREGKRFRRKEQVLTPPNYALSEYLREVKTNQGYSEKYVEHIKATGQQIEKVEIAIENEIKRAKLTELKRRQEYLEQSAAALEKYSEQDFIRAEKLESIIGAECHSRNIYEQQLEHSATYVQNALQAYVQDPSKEQTLAEHEHVLRYTLQEYQEEIGANQGYSPKYEEYVKTTGQRNQEIEAAINEEVQKLKEHDQARKTEVLKEILAEIKEKDPRKAIVLNSLLEKERAARNNYETERQKLSAYVTALENVTASRESYVPQYTRNEYLAEIQANHGYSPKYLEDLRRTGNEQRDKEIEAEIEHAMKRYDEQELYRRSNFIDNFETEVEKLNAYAIKIEEIIATEHPLRSEYDAKAARVSSYTDKAHRDYLERNQGLGMKATNFIFGANRAPQYSLEEYLTEIEENQGYSPKYEEYVQKTGQLISEVEEARLLAETRFEAQEAVRKQENIRIALEQLVEEEQVKGDKLERIVAEEHLNRSVYEERRETGKAYVEEALAYHQTYVLPKIELNRKREGKRFRRKEQVLTPPNYALSEYLREVKTNQGYSEKYVEHIKATGQQIEKVEIAIENEIKRAKLTELKRRQEYLEQSAAALEKYSEQDFIRAEKLESIIGAECHSRNIYEQQLEHSATYVQNALQAYVQDPSKEQTLAEHEHVLRYTLQEYQEEISVNQGYSPKYEEYVKTTGQRNQEIEAAINEEVQKLKEHDQARKTEVLKEILAEIKEKDPRKAIVLNSLLEKERAARNNYETERQKLSAYVTALENVTASRESYVPQYTRNEYLAEIQANHGYSPKYLEDLRRTGNEQRDKEIEAEIEHAMKRYDEQELYRRSNFIDNFETEVEKLNAYAIKIEEIIATEHPLRSEYDAKAARVSSYTDKAHRDYLERNQGLGMKVTNFIFGANRAPQYSLEEYLTEIEENQGYSPKYEEYVQKTGQLISEVEEARLLAETRFEAQEAVRKQENIRIALEQLVEEEQVKGDKLERIVAEEHLNRSVYEERRETGKAYVEEALAYHQTYVLPKIELNRKREGKRFRRKEQVLTPPNYALSEYLREVKTNQGYSEKYVEHIKATGQQIEKVEIAIENEIKRAKLTELKRRQEYLEQSAAALEKYSEQDFIRAEKLESIIGAECHSRNIYEQQLEHSATYVQNALQAYVQDPSKEQTLAEHEHVLRYTLQEYQEEISVNQGYSPKYEEYVKTTGQRNQEIEAAINEEVQKLKEHDQARKTEVLKEILAEIKEKDPRKAIVLNSLLEKERAARNNYETERQKLSAYVTALENVTASRESYVPQYTRNEYLAEIQANHGYSPKYLEDLRRTGNEQRDKEIEAEIEHAIKRYDEQELYRRSNFIDNLGKNVKEADRTHLYVREIEKLENEIRIGNEIEKEIKEEIDQNEGQKAKGRPASVRTSTDEGKLQAFYIGSFTDEIYSRAQRDGLTDTGLGSIATFRDNYKTLKEYLYNNAKRSFKVTKDGKVKFSLLQYTKATVGSAKEHVYDRFESDGVTDTGAGAISLLLQAKRSLSGFYYNTYNLREFLKRVKRKLEGKEDQAYWEEFNLEEYEGKPKEYDEEYAEIDEEFERAKEEVEEVQKEFEDAQEEIEKEKKKLEREIIGGKGKEGKPGAGTARKAKEVGKQVTDAAKEKGAKAVRLVRGTGKYGVLKAKEAGTKLAEAARGTGRKTVDTARDAKTKVVDAAKKADEAYDRFISKHFSEDAILGGGSGRKATEPVRETDVTTLDAVKDDSDDWDEFDLEKELEEELELEEEHEEEIDEEFERAKEEVEEVQKEFEDAQEEIEKEKKKLKREFIGSKTKKAPKRRAIRVTNKSTKKRYAPKGAKRRVTRVSRASAGRNARRVEAETRRKAHTTQEGIRRRSRRAAQEAARRKSRRAAQEGTKRLSRTARRSRPTTRTIPKGKRAVTKTTPKTRAISRRTKRLLHTERRAGKVQRAAKFRPGRRASEALRAGGRRGARVGGVGAKGTLRTERRAKAAIGAERRARKFQSAAKFRPGRRASEALRAGGRRGARVGGVGARGALRTERRAKAAIGAERGARKFQSAAKFRPGRRASEALRAGGRRGARVGGVGAKGTLRTERRAKAAIGAERRARKFQSAAKFRPGRRASEALRAGGRRGARVGGVGARGALRTERRAKAAIGAERGARKFQSAAKFRPGRRASEALRAGGRRGARVGGVGAKGTLRTERRAKAAIGAERRARKFQSAAKFRPGRRASEALRAGGRRGARVGGVGARGALRTERRAKAAIGAERGARKFQSAAKFRPGRRASEALRAGGRRGARVGGVGAKGTLRTERRAKAAIGAERRARKFQSAAKFRPGRRASEALRAGGRRGARVGGVGARGALRTERRAKAAIGAERGARKFQSAAKFRPGRRASEALRAGGRRGARVGGVGAKGTLRTERRAKAAIGAERRARKFQSAAKFRPGRRASEALRAGGRRGARVGGVGARGALRTERRAKAAIGAERGARKFQSAAKFRPGRRASEALRAGGRRGARVGGVGAKGTLRTERRAKAAIGAERRARKFQSAAKFRPGRRASEALRAGGRRGARVGGVGARGALRTERRAKAAIGAERGARKFQSAAKFRPGRRASEALRAGGRRGARVGGVGAKGTLRTERRAKAAIGAERRARKFQSAAKFRPGRRASEALRAGGRRGARVGGVGARGALRTERRAKAAIGAERGARKFQSAAKFRPGRRASEALRAGGRRGARVGGVGAKGTLRTERRAKAAIGAERRARKFQSAAKFRPGRRASEALRAGGRRGARVGGVGARGALRTERRAKAAIGAERRAGKFQSAAKFRPGRRASEALRAGGRRGARVGGVGAKGTLRTERRAKAAIGAERRARKFQSAAKFRPGRRASEALRAGGRRGARVGGVGARGALRTERRAKAAIGAERGARKFQSAAKFRPGRRASEALRAGGRRGARVGGVGAKGTLRTERRAKAAIGAERRARKFQSAAKFRPGRRASEALRAGGRRGARVGGVGARGALRTERRAKAAIGAERGARKFQSAAKFRPGRRASEALRAGGRRGARVGGVGAKGTLRTERRAKAAIGAERRARKFQSAAKFRPGRRASEALRAGGRRGARVGGVGARGALRTERRAIGRASRVGRAGRRTRLANILNKPILRKPNSIAASRIGGVGRAVSSPRTMRAIGAQKKAIKAARAEIKALQAAGGWGSKGAISAQKRAIRAAYDEIKVLRATGKTGIVSRNVRKTKTTISTYRNVRAVRKQGRIIRAARAEIKALQIVGGKGAEEAILAQREIIATARAKIKDLGGGALAQRVGVRGRARLALSKVKKNRIVRLSAKSLNVGWRTFGVLTGDPIEIARLGIKTGKAGIKAGKLGVQGVKTGVRAGYHMGQTGARYSYRQVLRADKFILNKAGPRTKGAYRIAKAGAKYAYRTPKVIGEFVYAPIKEVATKVALRLRGTRAYRIASKGYKLGRSTFGVLRKGPQATIKAGAKATYRISWAGARYSYRQVLKADQFLLKKSGFYGKVREGAQGAYHIAKAGAKYAYRTPKVIGEFVYAPIKEAATKMALRLRRTRAYRIVSKGYKLGRSTFGVLRKGPQVTIKVGAKGTYRIAQAGADFLYRQTIKADQILLKKSGFYGKIREGIQGAYRITEAGAKYAYRTPKVLGEFVYNPLKDATGNMLLRVKGTRTYRFSSQGLRLAQNVINAPGEIAKKGVKFSYNVGRAGALRAYRMAAPSINITKQFTMRYMRMALGAMRHIARIVMAKIAGALAAFAPIILKIALILGIVLGLVIVINSIITLIMPTNFILVDQEVLVNYIEQVGIYDGEVSEYIAEIRKNAEQEYIYACPSRDLKDDYGVIERRKHSKYNEGIHVIYENIVPVDGHICTDWQGVIALAAVLNQQNFEFSQKEQELLRQIHGKLNRVEYDMETLPCPCYRSSLDYDGHYFTGPCYSHDYEAPEVDPNLPEEEKAAKEAEKEYIERWVIPNLSPCCSPYCTSEWGCYAEACCPGHRRLNIHVYIYELDEEIQIGGETTTMLEEILKENGLGDAERQWWENLMREDYDLNEQFRGMDVDQYRCQYKYSPPAGLPECWPDDWGYPSKYPPPLDWKPRNWPDNLPFIFKFEYLQECPPEQQTIPIQ